MSGGVNLLFKFAKTFLLSIESLIWLVTQVATELEIIIHLGRSSKPQQTSLNLLKMYDNLKRGYYLYLWLNSYGDVFIVICTHGSIQVDFGLNWNIVSFIMFVYNKIFPVYIHRKTEIIKKYWLTCKMLSFQYIDKCTGDKAVRKLRNEILNTSAWLRKQISSISTLWIMNPH